MFANWRAFGKKCNKTIILYYGVSGHGKGLVDSMSSFGVKGLLRKSIVTDNLFFNDVEQVKAFRAETPWQTKLGLQSCFQRSSGRNTL